MYVQRYTLQLFTQRISVNEEVIGKGVGKSRLKAKNEAAREALITLGVILDN